MDRQTAELNAQAQMTSGKLIAADKVEGASVFNPAGEKLGSIDHVMLDKVTGQAVYAIMAFGGFLGIGEQYWPVPWSQLKYDNDQGGYVVNLDKRQLEGAPSYEGANFIWTPEYGRTVDKYYGTRSYWD